MIEVADSVRQELGAPYRAVCRQLEVPYSSLMRWKSRVGRGDTAVGKPGPAKVEPLDLENLNAEIARLAHGRERTRGTGALYGRHRTEISRRDLQNLGEAARREMRREKEALERRIEWLVPGLVWSMDDAQLERLVDGHGHMHVVHDLGSRYTLKSLGSRELADGMKVAGYVESLIERHGAPLFMKMDNGGNLNHRDVLGVLGERGVIPLNSPPHYPPYNGAVETKQQELQRQLAVRIGQARVEVRVFELETELSGHELNHKRRRSLGGCTACRVMDDGRIAARLFGRRERREVYEEIKALTVDIAGQLEEHTDVAVETAFRYAAETWMQQNNLIRVSRNGRVLPCFYQIRSH